MLLYFFKNHTYDVLQSFMSSNIIHLLQKALMEARMSLDMFNMSTGGHLVVCREHLLRWPNNRGQYCNLEPIRRQFIYFRSQLLSLPVVVCSWSRYPASLSKMYNLNLCESSYACSVFTPTVTVFVKTRYKAHVRCTISFIRFIFKRINSCQVVFLRWALASFKMSWWQDAVRNLWLFFLNERCAFFLLTCCWCQMPTLKFSLVRPYSSI